MNKPTQEQIKEFWEWGGFKFWQPVEGGAIDVLNPDGCLYLSPSKMAIPPIDLNNLFKWAVPKLGAVMLARMMGDCISTEYGATAFLGGEFKKASNQDPALALFWAIYKVIKEV